MARLNELKKYLDSSEIKFALENEEISIQVHKRKKGDHAIDDKRPRIQIPQGTDDGDQP